MSNADHIYILPYLNEQLLGDKIAYSSISEYLVRRHPCAEIVGVEEEGLLSMANYSTPPHSIIQGSVGESIGRILADYHFNETQNHKLVLCVDQNSKFPSTWMDLSEVIVIDLWDTLRHCADQQIFPRINVKSEWLEEADFLLRANGVSSSEPYIVVHIRLLRRQVWKNSDLRFFNDLLSKLVETLSMPIVIVGFQDERPAYHHPQIIDLSAHALRIEATAGLLAKAALFIGGDSGPMHLAGAVGCPVLGIGCVTERFGPFVPLEQLVGLFGSNLEGRITRLEDVEQVIKCIQNVFLAAPFI